MLKDSRSAARQQGFEYTQEGWARIQQIVAQGCGDADKFFERGFDGQPVSRFRLRDALGLLATRQQRQAKNLPKLTVPRIRKGLERARDQVSAIREGSETLGQSGILKLNLQDVGYDASLPARYQEVLSVLTPLLDKIDAQLAKQLAALGSSDKSRNASKPELNEYYAAILGMWTELVPDAELNRRLRLQFFLAVAQPVVGMNVATPHAVDSWLRRHSDI